VGVTTAKTFAYAVGAEVMGVSTLEAIAHQAPRQTAKGGDVQAVLDALRRELFVGRFKSAAAGRESDGVLPLERQVSDRLLAADAWLSELTAGTVVTGSGLQRLVTRLPAGVVAVDTAHWQPQAATVGRLAWRDYEAGRRDDLWKLAPLYLRPSYAEEKARKG
jgi:tRNA threonylcarbamoyladenosine biosynthesis protein TsaB